VVGGRSERGAETIAEAVGVSDETVRRATLGTSTDVEVVGADGKARPAHYAPRELEEEAEEADEDDERAMIAARMANMRQGERTDLEPSADLRNVISQPEAAELLNISERSIQDAKLIERASSSSPGH